MRALLTSHGPGRRSSMGLQVAVHGQGSSREGRLVEAVGTLGVRVVTEAVGVSL